MRLMCPFLTCHFSQMREGSDTFLVHAYLPVEASFGLADEMRRRCSGAASVSLLLSHWERVEVSSGMGGRGVGGWPGQAAVQRCGQCEPSVETLGESRGNQTGPTHIVVAQTLGSWHG